MNKNLQYTLEKSIIQKWKFCLLVTFIILTSAGCQKNTAENTLSEYLNHTFLDNNGKKAYELISSEDKKYISQREFISETKRKNIFIDKFLKNYKSQFSYKISQTRQTGSDTIQLRVTLIKPNTEILLNEIVTFTMTSPTAKTSGRNKQQIIGQKLDKIMTKKGLKKEVEIREFTLVKENQKYKICLNLNPNSQPKIVHNSCSRRY